MTGLPTEARELLESDALVHLVTINSDGSPHVSGVWVGLDGGEIVSGHMTLARS
jgi:Pyridoxamine 5'-phosphate oxidase